MKRIASILVVVFLLTGCGWFERKDRIIQPEEETPASALPAETGETSATPAASPGPEVGTTTKPSELPATRPSADYRVVGKPEVVAAASLQVNNKFITLQNLLDPIGPKLAGAAGGGANEEAFRIRASGLIRDEIRRQVEHVLLLAEAENYLTDEEKKKVDESVVGRLREAVAESEGSRTRFEQRLRDEGTDLATWQKDLTEMMLIRNYMENRLGKRIVVGRRMMWDYFVSHSREFSRSDRVQMQIISVSGDEFLPKDREPAEEDREESHRKAKELIDKAADALAKGGKFDEVAKKFSAGPMAASGGVWPLMERGSFRAEAVEESAFAQGVGRTSGVIETPGGFYIVRTLDIRGGEKLTFEKVQEEIADRLRRQQFQKLAGEYREKLYEKAVVIDADRFERIAVDEAVRKYYQKS